MHWRTALAAISVAIMVPVAASIPAAAAPSSALANKILQAALESKPEATERFQLASWEQGFVDYIRVEKSLRRMTLWADGVPVREFPVRLGRRPIGPKQEQGDGKTPEGLYFIDGRNPNSGFHLSLHISYPGPDDLLQAQARGVNPGGAIVIHGLPDDTPKVRDIHEDIDWTNGCIAVTNRQIEEIWHLVPNGALIEILP